MAQSWMYPFFLVAVGPSQNVLNVSTLCSSLLVNLSACTPYLLSNSDHSRAVMSDTCKNIGALISAVVCKSLGFPNGL